MTSYPKVLAVSVSCERLLCLHGQYDSKTLEEAVDLVKNGLLDAVAASKRFGIPASTIRKYKLYNCSVGAGRETALTHEQEDTIVKILVAYDEWGYPRSRRETLDLVKKFVQEMGLSKKFTHGSPGVEWLRLFLTRWKTELTSTSINLEKRRAVCLTRQRVDA
ncbi:unnamed protein product [Didymodactylos carnosus]|uniref:HTH CENPB-type domain-containing protein n=1 Tax=Didymodactylos carnosus TaxID=1234261 RepID=A0A8S2FPD7_9BILA|nr:unnamed protein product [Didymodactylos carnosus]CAF4311890.1 unnamed protein product [Didymodactylos carnosus]